MSVSSAAVSVLTTTRCVPTQPVVNSTPAVATWSNPVVVDTDVKTFTFASYLSLEQKLKEANTSIALLKNERSILLKNQAQLNADGRIAQLKKENSDLKAQLREKHNEVQGTFEALTQTELEILMLKERLQAASETLSAAAAASVQRETPNEKTPFELKSEAIDRQRKGQEKRAARHAAKSAAAAAAPEAESASAATGATAKAPSRKKKATAAAAATPMTDEQIAALFARTVEYVATKRKAAGLDSEIATKKTRVEESPAPPPSPPPVPFVNVPVESPAAASSAAAPPVESPMSPSATLAAEFTFVPVETSVLSPSSSSGISESSGDASSSSAAPPATPVSPGAFVPDETTNNLAALPFDPDNLLIG